MDPETPGPEYPVTITDVALPEGHGVARVEGMVVFIPGTLTGDKLRIRIDKKTNRFSTGRATTFEELSPFRIEPACPHFHNCGGCNLQHLAYEKELELKENHLRQTLRRIGALPTDSIPIDPIIPSPRQEYYRTKIELAFGEARGRLALGMRRRISSIGSYSREVVPLEGCRLFSPVLARLIPIVTNYMEDMGFKAYDPLKKKGLLRHLVVREAKATDQLMITLETMPGKIESMEGLWRVLADELPEVKSLWRSISRAPGDLIRYDQVQHLFGSPWIEEKLGPYRFRIYPPSFFQPNSTAAWGLYNRIGELFELTGSESILGLYCGTGPIEILLSSAARRVKGIDSLPQNIANALENCAMNGITNCRFQTGDAEEIMKKPQKELFDLLVIDPPRGGISHEGLEGILRLKTERIAYISCNPATLARDLKVLTEGGYYINRMLPADFFPRTGHMETLAALSRKR